MLEPSLTPRDNLSDFQLGLIQGTKIKGRKEVTMEDYVDYSKTSGIGRFMSKIGFIIQGKGLVNEKSLHDLAIKKLGSLNNEQLGEIDKLADEVLGKDNTPESSKERKKMEKEKDCATQTRLLVKETYSNKDEQVRFGLSSLGYYNIQNNPCLKDLFEKFQKQLLQPKGIDTSFPSKHTHFAKIEEAAQFLLNSNWQDVPYYREQIAAGFIEFLVEQITEDKLPLGIKKQLEVLIETIGNKEELEAFQNIAGGPQEYDIFKLEQQETEYSTEVRDRNRLSEEWVALRSLENYFSISSSSPLSRMFLNYVAAKEQHVFDVYTNEKTQNEVVDNFIDSLVQKLHQNRLDEKEIQALKEAIEQKTDLLKNFVEEKPIHKNRMALLTKELGKNLSRERQNVKALETIGKNKNVLASLEDFKSMDIEEETVEFAEEVSISKEEEGFFAMTLSEIAKDPQYEKSFSAFADEVGKKLEKYDVNYFKQYKTLGTSEENIQEVIPMQIYFSEKTQKVQPQKATDKSRYERNFTLDLSQLRDGTSTSKLLKDLFAEYLKRQSKPTE